MKPLDATSGNGPALRRVLDGLAQGAAAVADWLGLRPFAGAVAPAYAGPEPGLAPGAGQPASRPGGLIATAIDHVVGFVAIERSLILRNIRIEGQGHVLKAFSSMLRIFVVIIAHVYMYWAIQRGMPGSISYLAYNTGAFGLWSMFTTVIRHAAPSTIAARFNKSLNVKWAHLFIADMVWETSKVILAMTITLSAYALFPVPYLGKAVTMPNIPLLLAMLFLAGMLGAGFGMILRIAKRQWPMIEACVEVIMWLLFVTSGIYESYVNLPPIVAVYFKYNPMMGVIEYSRMALDPGYPVGDLTLTYTCIMALVFMGVGLALHNWEQRAQRS